MHFKEANVLVAGDVLSVGAYPVIDYCTNGWIGGMVNATQTLRGLCDCHTTRVIPRHRPGTRAAPTSTPSTSMLAALKLKLSQLLAQGMSAQDMLAAASHPRHSTPSWGDPALFVANVWPGLVERARELGVSIV